MLILLMPFRQRATDSKRWLGREYCQQIK